MDKALCYGALGVAVLMLVVFLLDLVAGFPFGRGAGSNPFFLVDIFGVLSSAIVGYLAWNASRDLR
jgi:hypothetical protein